MKKQIKSFWGCIPLILFVFCVVCVFVIQTTTDQTLRIVPCNILVCMGIGSFAILFLWCNIKLRIFCKKSGKLCFRILTICINGLSFFLVAVFTLISILIMLYSYNPEHVVTRNGIKMVASVHSFLDEQVYYYQYKNWFFYGKELGYEYYGNGGNDPLVQTPKPTPDKWYFYDPDGTLIESSIQQKTEYDNKDQKQSEPILLEIESTENAKNESLFSVSIEDFISSYNSIYQQVYHTSYLSSSSDWTQGNEKTPYFQYHSVCYLFSADKQIWNMPTISIYTSKNGNGIYEIKLTFGDHNNREIFYEEFKNICFYSLKVFLPKLNNTELDSLYKKLYAQTNANYYDEYDTNSNAQNGTFHMIYSYGEIGFYGYNGTGTANISIIPITENTRKKLEKNGIQIHELE